MKGPQYVATTRIFGAMSCATTLMACEQMPADTVHPTFEIAGIVEGFYGSPWSHEDRLDIIDFMGEVGLNAYFYAPKADPYHLSRWREPYPPAEWEHLRELAARSNTNGVTLWYAISPGLSMQYGTRADYAALLSKIDTIGTLGLAHFGLFLDDVPLQLTNTSDIDEFGDLVSAHISLINRLYADLESRGYQLAVTPTVYTSAWDSPAYIDRLGAEVHPNVLLIWTGPDVATSQITHEQSEAWSTRLRRRIILWDNYPVNDFAPWRLFLGPLRGRDPELVTTTLGILSNPMNQAHASMVPLFTVADYARDPQSYDADTSWQHAMDSVLGPPDREILAPIFQMFGDYAADPNLLEPLHFLPDTIDITSIDENISALETALAVARNKQDSSNARVRKMLDEFEPTVERARRRLNAVLGDPRYNASHGLLSYSGNDVQIDLTPSAGQTTMDGSLTDWINPRWYALTGPIDGEVSFAADDQYLYFAIRSRLQDIEIREGVSISQGTHVGLIITHDLAADRISPEDLFLLVAPSDDGSDGSYFLGAMKFEGFMAKWLADNENLTLTDFHLTTFGDTISAAMSELARGIRFTSQRSRDGFSMEIRVPHQSKDQRVSLTISSRVNGRMRSSAISQRNYPINPNTFVRLRLPAAAR